MACLFYFARCINIVFNSLLAQLVKYDVYTTRKIVFIHAIIYHILLFSIYLLNAEVDTASTERKSYRRKEAEAASDAACLPSYIYVDRPVFSAAAVDPDLGDAWIRVVEAGRRSVGTTARHHGETRRADCQRQNEDLTASTAAAAAAAGHSYYPTVSAMEPRPRRTHHLTAKKSPQPLDCERI